MLQEMLEASLYPTSPKYVAYIGTSDTPSQARSCRYRGICLLALVKKRRAQTGAALRTQLLRGNHTPTPLDQTVCFIADGS